MAAALDALHALNRRPAVNVRFLFEGEEEAGSPHLGEDFSKHFTGMDRRQSVSSRCIPINFYVEYKIVTIFLCDNSAGWSLLHIVGSCKGSIKALIPGQRRKELRAQAREKVASAGSRGAASKAIVREHRSDEVDAAHASLSRNLGDAPAIPS